jgi:ATP-dependent Clp protease adaptor protein ClpS
MGEASPRLGADKHAQADRNARRSILTLSHHLHMTPVTVAPAEIEIERPTSEKDTTGDRPWLVIVWNDPINLMLYVTFVFQKLFGYSREKARRLMLKVHRDGRAVVSSGTLEKAEYDVARLHAHGLWATMRQD